MTTTVLVVTPYQAFGELLCLSLEDEGRYSTRLVKSGFDAVETLVQPDYQIAVLDGDLPDTKLLELTTTLLSGIPDLKLVIIPPENNPKHAALEGVTFHGYLLRPFYQPDLLTMMSSLTNGTEARPGSAMPGWLSDKLLLDALGSTNARGGLLLHRDGSTLMSGELPPNVVEVLKSAARRGLQGSEHTDMVRFVRLPGQSKDHLFYITLVTADIVLALTYMVGTPLSRVRVQATQVVASLAAHAPLQPLVAEGDTLAVDVSDAVVAKEAGETAKSEEGAEVISPVATAQPPVNESGPQRGADAPAAEAELVDEDLGEDAEITEINLAALLGDVPPPDPGKVGDTGWVPEIAISLPRPQQDEPVFPWDESDFQESARAQQARQPAPLKGKDARESDAAWAEVLQALPPVESPVLDEDTRPVVTAARTLPTVPVEPAVEAAPPAVGEALDETIPVPRVAGPGQPAHSAGWVEKASFILEEPPINELEDTRPHVLTHLTNIQQIEPVTPAYSQLSYTCVLIPRLPKHHLTGRLGEKLSQWVQQLCLAFGWRLEGIAVRPEYLQWTVQVSPAIAPGNLVRVIRQRVSDVVFETYPALSRENPSGDFWATGYLIVGGPQPPSPRLLRDYIAETRRRQGVTAGGESLALQGEAQPGLPAGSPATTF